MATSPVGTNWSGNYRYRSTTLHQPRSVEELRGVVARGTPVRALGTRHAFTGIGDAAELISLERLPADITVDSAARTVSLAGPVTYAQLAGVLNDCGMALHSLASLPHISVAGAVATASHGSGDQAGNLATAVRCLQLVDGTGELVEVHAEDERFDGLVVGLGATGIITRLTLALEPYYEMRQWVFEDVSWDVLFDRYDRITAAAESVSVFHGFGERIEQLWIKRRTDRTHDPEELHDLLEARPATTPHNPVPGAEPANCTDQLGLPGPWSERLPHFRSGFTPSAGEEIQSEFFIARTDAASAVRALRALAPVITPVLLVSELRTIAADTFWLSPQYRRDTTAIHFTWRRREDEVIRAVAAIEDALAPFAARPHWGKVFTAGADRLAPLYPRMGDFLRLRDQLDPDGMFVNDWLRRRVIGGAMR